MRFDGTDQYVATPDLKVAVNAAVTLRRPLLVKGEPGTGKTILAHEIARAVGAPLIEWNVKSTTKAQQGLYEYDAVARLRDGQLGDERVHDISNYIRRGKLVGSVHLAAAARLLIDEIDKADIEFPNDLLQELDRMEFHVYETKETVRAVERPIVVITSNNEKELPDAFLRRCFFHYIKFPDRDTMQAIIDVHFPGISRCWSQSDGHLLRGPRGARPQEEAVHQRADRLAEAALTKTCRSRSCNRAIRTRRFRRSTARCSRTSRT
jgi:MoxR-like ATPase